MTQVKEQIGGGGGESRSQTGKRRGNEEYEIKWGVTMVRDYVRLFTELSVRIVSFFFALFKTTHARRYNEIHVVVRLLRRKPLIDWFSQQRRETVGKVFLRFSLEPLIIGCHALADTQCKNFFHKQNALLLLMLTSL